MHSGRAIQVASLPWVLAGSAVTTIGAVVITWPVLTGKKEDDRQYVATSFDFNPFILESLRKQRRFAIVGTALALIGVAIQDVGAALP